MWEHCVSIEAKPRQDRDEAGEKCHICQLIEPCSGWGTWIRTKIDGVRVRSSTVELSPTGLCAGRGVHIAKTNRERNPILRPSVQTAAFAREAAVGRQFASDCGRFIDEVTNGLAPGSFAPYARFARGA
jgi:hypothetical protein